jgi:methionyl-tRNA formyltransferase
LKIAYTCSHWMGLPTLELIQSKGILAGIAVPDAENDSVHVLKQIANRTGVSLLVTDRANRRKSFETWLTDLQADALFVLSFPWKIPDAVLKIPRSGCYNFHPGIVPAYRGIEPIFWTLKNGEKQTAVSVLRMDRGFDTGNTVLAKSLPVHPDDTYGLLLNKLAVTARDAVEMLLQKLTAGEDTTGAVQPSGSFAQRKRPNAKELSVNWNEQTAEQIRNLVRAANPAFGGAVSYLRNVPFQLLGVSVHEQSRENNVMPGTVLFADASRGFCVACLHGVLKIDIISSQEGIFTGEKFAALFGIKKGELFTA